MFYGTGLSIQYGHVLNKSFIFFQKIQTINAVLVLFEDSSIKKDTKLNYN